MAASKPAKLDKIREPVDPLDAEVQNSNNLTEYEVRLLLERVNESRVELRNQLVES